MRKLIGWIYILIFVGEVLAADIIEINNSTFIKQDGMPVTLYQKNHIESRTFRFTLDSFLVQLPPQLQNITVIEIKDKSIAYAEELIVPANRHIQNSFSTSCDQGPRGKRFIPIVIIGGIVLLMAVTGLFVANYVYLKQMERKIAELREALETLKKLNENEKILNSYKFEIQNYVARYQAAATDMIKLFKSGATVTASEIPDVLLKHFNVKSGNDKIFFLRMLKCTNAGFDLSITVAETKNPENIECNYYTHMGYFENNLFRQYEIPHMSCYYNDTCQFIQEKHCLSRFDTLQCPTDALEFCICEVNDIEKCKLKTQITSANFLYYEQIGSLVSVATKTAKYTIVKSHKSLTTSVPKSGIFSIMLNEEDKLEIGDTIIYGSSDHATFVAHVIESDFELPSTEKSIVFPWEKTQSFFFKYKAELLVFGICAIFIILVIVVFCILKNCMK